ncbi:hypothetical protein [Pseudacidovorax sp. RU35E]|uniref:hypothetical protein n=1 Tax=Pseudacidovorax sp. RU35E TaxID=1907403 RepID=UPI0009574708|nr:hypothetical protein [Pseudacidovorax sp. RU35E]SIR60371.1 hypothetical protein SAMN05880557_11489 [Pseudacidovorax sp. RU35E]
MAGTTALLVDAALAIAALELVMLLALRRPALVWTLLAGLALMVALRLAVAGAQPASVALALAAGGLVHVIDLKRRWAAQTEDRASLSVSPPHEGKP